MFNRPKKLNLSPENREKIVKIFDVPKEQVLPEPSREDIMAMMAELREMGFEDIPIYEGISSSMRQYVWGVLGMKIKAGISPEPSQEPLHFVTMDEKLIAHADQLQEKYGVKPITIDQFYQENKQFYQENKEK
jgi:hypothetical protein